MSIVGQDFSSLVRALTVNILYITVIILRMLFMKTNMNLRYFMR